MDCDVAFNGATTGAHSAKVVKPCEPLKDTTTSLAHNGKRPIINDVNPEITCVLCAGYFVNATTIVECLHTCMCFYRQKVKGQLINFSLSFQSANRV